MLGPSWPAVRRVRVFAQITTLVILVAGMVVVAALKLDFKVDQCNGAVERWRSFALVLASLGGFISGHLLTRWLDSNTPLKQHRKSVQFLPHRLRDAGNASSRRLVQIALVALLLFGVLALAYETWAVWGTPPPYPITWEVRCLANSGGWAFVAAGTFAVSFLLGHWVWFAPDRPDA